MGPRSIRIVAKEWGKVVDFDSVQFGAQTSYWGENETKDGSPNTSLIYAGARARIYPELDPGEAVRPPVRQRRHHGPGRRQHG